VTRFQSLIFVLALAIAMSQADAAPMASSETIAPGTKITMTNWQQYRQFMPEGMQALFEGKYFWRMPADVEMVVGPTVIHPLPKAYLEATEKYSSSVKVVSLPNGGYNLTGYVAGIPFPDPQEPQRGWKMLANVWYRYLPHLIVATPANLTQLCVQDSYNNISCTKESFVYRQLQHNTDPDTPMVVPGASPKDYTEWSMVEQPEELKYKASLTIFYQDLTQPEDIYAFIPELRRSLRGSTASRCAPAFGSDLTPDDFRFGFNGNITRFNATVLGEKKILALTAYSTASGNFPASYDMPLGWPKASWGNWELRDVYVLDVRRIPSQAAGYCYGKRIMYVDKVAWAPLWEDLYDSNMQLWKIVSLMPRTRNVPGVGIQMVSGSQVTQAWDVIRKHATHFMDPTPDGRDTYVNSEVPNEYLNVTKYCGPAGLNEIMR
jgi:hypothetical protein